MITANVKQDFEARGIICLKNFLSTEKVERAQQLVREHLGAQGIWQTGTWKLDDYAPSIYNGSGKEFVKDLKKRRVWTELLEAVQEPNTELLDGQPISPESGYPQVLFTLPNATSWSLPSTVWHLDCPRLTSGGIPGVQAFTEKGP